MPRKDSSAPHANGEYGNQRPLISTKREPELYGLPRPLLSIGKVAAWLGVSETMLYKGRLPIPSIRIGRRILFKEESVLDYIEANLTTPQASSDDAI